MAGAGYKLFNTGDVLTAAQVNTYLQEQTVMVFANAAARTTALSGVLAEGMVTFLKDTDSLEIYSGTAWVSYGSGDLTAITAGTGITVTSGTGPIPTVALTTPVAATNGGTAQTTYTTGDLLYASGTNTLAKRAIGSTGNVLTVSGGVPTWAAPGGSSSNWTLITSGTSTTGTSVSLAVSGYDKYILHFNIYSATTGVTMKFRLNNLSATNYTYGAFMSGATTTQTNVDGINLDNFSTFNEQPCGFLEINNANTGTKPQFFGSWRRPNNANNNLINYSGIYNANITLSSIDLVSTATISDFTYRLWGL